MKKLLLILLVGLIIISGCGKVVKVKKVEEITDNEKFAQEFDISKENNFKYLNYDELMDVLNNKSGIIFLGSGDCEWCKKAAKLLNESLKYKDIIEDIYYYNPKKIKANNNKKYQELLKILDPYLTEDEDKNKELLLPDIYFVKKGKIIDHNNDLATIKTNPEEYLTKERKKEIREKYEDLISKYNVKECKTC